MIQKPRGTIDILPGETPLWRFIENTARRNAAKDHKPPLTASGNYSVNLA